MIIGGVPRSLDAGAVPSQAIGHKFAPHGASLVIGPAGGIHRTSGTR